MSENISIRVTSAEKEMAQKLANYLHLKGSVEKPTISDAIRVSLHFMVGEITKYTEAERYGGRPKQ